MRWTKNGNGKIHNEMKENHVHIHTQKNIEWMNVKNDTHTWHCLTSPQDVKKKNTAKLLFACHIIFHVVSNPIQSIYINIFFDSFFIRLLFVCLGLRTPNWLEILMGLMCHPFIFFFPFDSTTQWKKESSLQRRTSQLVLLRLYYNGPFNIIPYSYFEMLGVPNTAKAINKMIK